MSSLQKDKSNYNELKEGSVRKSEERSYGFLMCCERQIKQTDTENRTRPIEIMKNSTRGDTQ